MSGVIIELPKCHLLKVTLTTPSAAALVAVAMMETGEMRKPWYGFSITPGVQPSIYGCCVTVRVNNQSGDSEGLEANRGSIRLRGYRVFTPDQIRIANAPARVIPIA